MSNYKPDDTRGQQKLAIASKNIPPLPDKHYRLIVADFPWQYHLRETDASHRGRTPYPTMTDMAILNFPMAQLAEPSGCLLLNWFTNNHLPLAAKCISNWGFSYKTVHHWIKTTKDSTEESPIARMGVGHWGRNCSESFVVAIYGKIPSFTSLGLTKAKNVIFAPRTEHSRKPEEFWDLANELKEKLGGEAIELFSRQSREGWDTWGLEAGDAKS